MQRNWRKENKEHIKDYNQKHYAEKKTHYKLVRKRYYNNNKPKFKALRIKWTEENPELVRLYSQRYNAKKKALPYDLSADELDDIYSQFNYSCALTGTSKNLHHEHFICIDTGHMGTTYGNIIPLDGSLNISKNNKNPFEWIKDFPKYQINFNYIVSILSSINGLSVDEYKQFVYWCYEYKRTIEEIENDQRLSIEIWLSSFKRI
ncbi:hypothetical protein FHP05_00180 [Cerasibacillus terrae]|uniref:HNH nuclease domain-containing protein n=1 Tax=Cerasibacillus terrae TaxID=2498845 RepID=A0A5C8P1J1_9BACI|nr:hypothetical protein FHP05_00180 [Cerasibacillus terrae]